MSEALMWLYLTNSVLLINHEIDSAYRKEWELFHLPGKITGFLLLHFPLLFAVLLGLVFLADHNSAGYVFSLIMCLGGIFAFSIHTYFLRKGRSEFDTPVSKLILLATLLISLVQLPVTIFEMLD